MPKGVSPLKLMTGIKLVNWHYFVNETIRLRGSTLITGDNGSGKSTIFDAIQMALIADQRKVRFNVSAHDETNRDLKGYLRCRTGRDDPAAETDRGYLRSGDFTSYVALEFTDTVRGEAAVVGMAVDTFAGEPDTPQFFRHAGPLDEALFVDGNRPRSVVEFRAHLKQRRSGEPFNSVAAYRTALLAQLGHLNERFFTLLIKGLAFHPITRIRDFVYDYLLDSRAVKIDAMLENFRQYRQYDHLVQQTNEKLDRLEEVARLHGDRTELERTAAIQEYVVLRAAREVAQGDLDRLRYNQAETQKRQAVSQAEQARLQGEINALEGDLGALRDARARNEAYLALRAVEQRLEELRRQVRQVEGDGQQLAGDVRQLIRSLQEALKLAETAPAALSLTDPEPLSVLAAAGPRLQRLGSGDLTAPALPLDELATALLELGDEISARIKGLSDERQALHTERTGLELDVRNKQIRYPRTAEALREAIAEALPGARAQMLCELIDVTDERWQNAVEGYLNTQRFDLFVPPDRFDDALRVYEAGKHERKIEGAGLVNSQALIGSHPRVEPGSLAQEISAADPAARAYVDRLLGRVSKCETEQQLKQHRVAITPTCMTYRNHTARQIEFGVYATPYVGSRALARQIELKKQRLAEIGARLEGLETELQACGSFRALVRSRDPLRIAERWEQLAQLPDLHAEIHRKEAERAQIDVGALNALVQQIQQKEALLEGRRRQGLEVAKAAGEIKRDLETAARDLQGAESAWQQRNAVLEAYSAAHPDLVESGAARYQEALRTRSPAMIEGNFQSNRQGNLTQIQNLSQQLFRLRLAYNNRYQFGGAPDAVDNAGYEQERAKLAGSELPAYAEKIAQARTAAEEEFKNHFIFKLQENIRLARQEFETLNRVLKGIPFGQDHYQFVCVPDRAYKHFYDMIMDDFAMEGFTLFSLDFRERYGETMDELFRLILDVAEERQAENIKRYTDYRTYLEFDIKIHHAGGETSSFSKVAKEKSGGETQTPFYVAMIASFLQLYRPKQTPHSLRLLMFDEAFNRMDADRAENTLQFIRRLGLQVLAAAPTDKCEIIAPHVETTLLALRDGDRAWLEDYHQVLAAAAGEVGE